MALALAGSVPARGAEPRIAARVDGDPIFLRDVDGLSAGKIDRVQADLARVAAAAVDELIDARLARIAGAAFDPTPAPVTEQAVHDFRVTRPADFDGSRGPAAAADPAVADPAIRHWLEQEARAAAAAEGRRARRRDHMIEITLPPATELAEVLPPDRTVARVDGDAIAAAELEQTAALRLYRLRGQIFRERSRNLKQAIDARLLEREAARRGTTATALVAAAAGSATVSDAEVDAFIERERAAGRPVPSRERARPYLEFQKSYGRRDALLDDMRGRATIEILLREPAAPLLRVSVDADAPALGPADGRSVIAFTNYRCRVCRATHAELDRLRAADPKVRVILRDFIPVYDPVAFEAARLARCAAKLGALAETRATLLARDPPPFGQPWLGAEDRAALARMAGVDSAALETCLAAAESDATITRDAEEARRLGFDEPPAFVVEGVPLSGMQSADGLVRALARGEEARR